MKNSQIGTRGKQAAACLRNNIDIISAMVTRVDASGKIIELSGDVGDSQIADVLDDCAAVLQSNNNAGAGVYNSATGKYKVSVAAFISNNATNSVEVAELDFSYFIADGAVKWDVISVDDAAFMAALLALDINLQQFTEAVTAFVL